MADVMVRQRPVKRRRYTVADFDWLAQLPQYQDARFEIIEGEIVDMPPVGEWHGFGSNRIGRLLDEFVEATGAGIVTTETGYYDKQDEATLLGPDVAFRRTGKQPDPDSDGFVPRMPDLAVEVKSPNDSTLQLRRKARLFLERGTEIVWLVYPERRQVEVCALDAAGDMTREIVGADGELSGGDVLPGFTLPLSRLFS